MSEDADNIIGLYERFAERYEADRNRSLSVERGWLERFCALLAPGATVLDIGCGLGEPIARHLVERGFAVTGVDASAAMIARCRRHFPDQQWHVADMRTLTLGRRFDGLLAWDSLFHLTPEDQVRMFPIFGAHAAPGAALLFTSGPARGTAMGSWYGEPLYHASLSPAEYTALLEENGFMAWAFMAEDPAAGEHSVWLARRRTDEAEPPTRQ